MQIARRHINLPWTKTEPFPSLLPWFFHSLPSCFLRLYLGFFTHYLTHYLGPWFCIASTPLSLTVVILAVNFFSEPKH
jgi:hypothetical protein